MKKFQVHKIRNKGSSELTHSFWQTFQASHLSRDRPDFDHAVPIIF